MTTPLAHALFARRSKRAFTLVELLIGMAIGGILTGATYAAYLAAHQSWEKSRIRSEHYQSIRVTFGIMERLLRSAIDPDAGEHIVFDGEDGVNDETELDADRLLFASSGARIVPGARNRTDLCQVEFFLDNEEGEVLAPLIIRKSLLPGSEDDDDAQEDELISNVASFGVLYYDGTEWVEDWYSADGLPSAVQISLAVVDPRVTEKPVELSRLIVVETH